MLTSRWSLILFDLKLINILQSIQNKNKKKESEWNCEKNKWTQSINLVLKLGILKFNNIYVYSKIEKNQILFL